MIEISPQLRAVANLAAASNKARVDVRVWAEMIAMLAAEQKELPEDAAIVLYENLWTLYE